MKPCLGVPGHPCGAPTPATRCPPCQQRHDRTRRPAPAARGYDTEYKRNRKLLLATHPRCAICGSAPATTADHIIPTSRGGTSALPNLRPACHPCNSARGNRPP